MAVALKHSAGWTKLVPSVVGVGAALGSIYLLAHAVKSLPMATSYAIWTGIGSVGVVLVGIALGESASAVRLVCIAAIVGGIVGLRLLEA